MPRRRARLAEEADALEFRGSFEGRHRQVEAVELLRGDADTRPLKEARLLQHVRHAAIVRLHREEGLGILLPIGRHGGRRSILRARSRTTAQRVRVAASDAVSHLGDKGASREHLGARLRRSKVCLLHLERNALEVGNRIGVFGCNQALDELGQMAMHADARTIRPLEEGLSRGQGGTAASWGVPRPAGPGRGGAADLRHILTTDRPTEDRRKLPPFTGLLT